MPKGRKPTMSWFWVVPLLWNKTPASSWSYQKQGPALRGRSLQELELSLAYVGYNNKEQGEISILEPKEVGVQGRLVSTEWLGCRSWELGTEGRWHKRTEIVPNPTQDSRLRTGD